MEIKQANKTKQQQQQQQQQQNPNDIYRSRIREPNSAQIVRELQIDVTVTRASKSNSMRSTETGMSSRIEN
jgi:hypothetical protein